MCRTGKSTDRNSGCPGLVMGRGRLGWGLTANEHKVSFKVMKIF